MILKKPGNNAGRIIVRAITRDGTYNIEIHKPAPDTISSPTSSKANNAQAGTGSSVSSPQTTDESLFSIRNMQQEDIMPFFRVTQHCWRDMEVTTPDMIFARFETFPQGMFVAVDNRNDEVIGCISTLRMNEKEMPHTWLALTGDGTFSTHRPKGDTLFCPQVSVLHEWRKSGVGAKLIQHALTFSKKQEIPHLIAFSRFGMHAQYAQEHPELPPLEFIKVSKPAKQEKLTKIQREFRKISEMPTGIQAYNAFSEQFPQLTADINSFYLLTGRRPFDRNIGFHFKLGARIGRVLPDGCPRDRNAGGAIVLMHYR